MSLPTPVGRQKEVLYLPAEGHHAVLGTAGSGKTTLAILRSAYLADPRTPHSGRTLLVTFNRALVAYLRHLRDPKLVEVRIENYHTFARGYLNSRGRMSRNGICGPEQRETLIEEAVSEMRRRNGKHPILERNVPFFSEEIRWMASSGIQDLDSYLQAERVGRIGVRVDRKSRPIVFDVFTEYLRRRASAGKLYDWDDMAGAACAELDKDIRPRLYRHIVIDEGQDFSPEMIRSLVKAIPPEGSLTFFGDMAQQIYGRRMSWRSAGLVIGEPWIFKQNYRNSKQITDLALAISRMAYFQGVPDLVAPVSPTAEGPPPTLVRFTDPNKEIKFVASQAAELARTQSVAILFRDRDDERKVAGQLPSRAIRLHREMSTWQAGPGIRYGTYHSAKGLEFDAVILPFFSAERLPDEGEVAAFGRDEAEAQDGKVVYVGVTRAKVRLIMTCVPPATNLLPTDTGLYAIIDR